MPSLPGRGCKLHGKPPQPAPSKSYADRYNKRQLLFCDQRNVKPMTRPERMALRDKAMREKELLLKVRRGRGVRRRRLEVSKHSELA